jgi:hypothetical protein
MSVNKKKAQSTAIKNRKLKTIHAKLYKAHISEQSGKKKRRVGKR